VIARELLTFASPKFLWTRGGRHPDRAPWVGAAAIARLRRYEAARAADQRQMKGVTVAECR
jgi:hypothetical protein